MYQEIENYINAIPKFTKKHDSVHTGNFLKKLGIDVCDMKEKIIHVAGTNGKGTVCAMLSAILVNCGKHTGLFTSPHLVKMNERIKIDGQDIDDDTFIRIFEQVKAVSVEMEQSGEGHPSYFEFLMGMGFVAFREAKVEYIVLETGLGGRLDATNVFPEVEMSIITSIGMDHMEYLGDTIEKIAAEKAGIIKKGAPVIYWGEDARVSSVLERFSLNQGISVKRKDYKILGNTNKTVDFCPTSGYYVKSIFSVPFVAEYQVENCMLVLRAVEMLDDIREEQEKIVDAIRNVKWEGRMEEIWPGVILDGAHNEPGIEAFTKAYQAYPNPEHGRKGILFSVVKDKDYEAMVRRLGELSPDFVIVTRLDSDRALDAARMKEEFTTEFEKKKIKSEITVIEDVREAFRTALSYKKKEDLLFCVGSLYLVGELKKALMEWRQL